MHMGPGWQYVDEHPLPHSHPCHPGYGFVNFTTPEEAYQAIQTTNNMQFGPCVLTVRLANSSKGSGKGLPPGGSMGMALGGLDGCPPSVPRKEDGCFLGSSHLMMFQRNPT